MLLKPEHLAPLGGEEKAVVDWLILKESRLAGVLLWLFPVHDVI